MSATFDTPAFLATLPPGRGQRRLALAVFLLSLLFFVAAMPFAKVQLAQVWAFIPVYQSALVVNDLITATLLFGQFRILRSRALLVLAAGYLFTACMAIAHGLSFPGLFAPGGLLGAGPQSTAWLYMVWHGGFPLFVIAYALLKNKPPLTSERGGTTGAVAATLAAVLALALAATLLATAGQDLLPGIMAGNRYTPTMILVVSSVWGCSLLALIVLWRCRPRSVLDLWLLVVIAAWLFDIALSAVVNGGRFDLGFYAGRIFGLLAASFVLVVLLLENSALYTWLAESHAREVGKSGELRRLGRDLEAANAMLAEKNSQLQEASLRKSEFLANMSHELRTPLNAIIGFSEVLKDGLLGDMSAQQREYVTDIFTSGRHLLTLINDILDLSKVEAGKMVLDLEHLEVGAILDSSLSIVREKAVAHRIGLVKDIPANLGPVLLDARKTRQIVYNLLSNAVKFTPDGGQVVLRARRVARQAVENWSSGCANSMCLPLPASDFAAFLEISVDDDGIGIKPEDSPRLFQPFSQLDASLARRFEGTGLGLAMVMSMAQLHGGTVAVASNPGQGSRFTVWLPWREATSARTAPPAPAPAERGGGLALVVEDNDAAAELARLQLEAEGLEVIRVGSAEAAFELLPTRHPQLIVLDILLPGMDGWDFLARIKQPDSPWTAVPVVICSIVADARKGFSLGAAQVLQKPVSRDEFTSALQHLGFRPQARNGLKIMIVDDDPKAVELLAAYLAETGCRVLRSYGGRDGIEMAHRERPDLMVLDLIMPEVSGFDVVDALKNCPATAAIPIVVVTVKEILPADRALLNGYVSAILGKADFNQASFISEVRRALLRERKAEDAR